MYVLSIVICPFVLFLLAIVLSGLLQYTVSDYLPLVSSNSSCAYLTTFAFLMPGEQFRLPRASKLKYRHTFQGRIHDFKLGGGVLKKIGPSGGRRENFWGISCEKSRFYAKKSFFFQLPREARKFLRYFVWKITILRQKIIFFSNFRRAPPPPLNPPLHLNLSHCILWDWKEDIYCCICAHLYEIHTSLFTVR